mmetsp:Transcript_27132/g.69128  ORF Transcript_27132/g.69128 Transcript_27132/m.69128 type:complete len:201 (+) Transcript_27132:311-913(+)
MPQCVHTDEVPAGPAESECYGVQLHIHRSAREDAIDEQLGWVAGDSWPHVRRHARLVSPPFCGTKLDDRCGCLRRQARDVKLEHVHDAKFEVLKPASHDASENLRWRYRMRSGHEEYTWHCSFQVEANAPQDDLCQEYRKPEEDEEEIHAVGSLSESIGCTSLPRELPRFLGRDNNQRGQIARLDHEHARVDKDQCQLDK